MFDCCVIVQKYGRFTYLDLIAEAYRIPLLGRSLDLQLLLRRLLLPMLMLVRQNLLVVLEDQQVHYML